MESSRLPVVDLINPAIMPKLEAVQISDKYMLSLVDGQFLERLAVCLKSYEQDTRRRPVDLRVSHEDSDINFSDLDKYGLLSSMTVIELLRSEIDNGVLPYLQKCVRLAELRIAFLPRTGTSFNIITFLPPSVKILGCFFDWFVPLLEQPDSRQRLQHVEYLDVSLSEDWVFSVWYGGPLSKSVGFTNLKTLIVDKEGTELQRKFIKDILDTNPLETFVVSIPSDLFKASYLPLPKTLRNLTVDFTAVDIEGTLEHNSRQFLSELLESLPALENLSISVGCFGVLNYPFLKSLAAARPHLRSICLEFSKSHVVTRMWTKEELIERLWHNFKERRFTVHNFCDQLDKLQTQQQFEKLSVGRDCERVLVNMDLLRLLTSEGK